MRHMGKFRYSAGAGILALLLSLAFLAVGREASAAFESGSTCGAAFYNSTTCRLPLNPTVSTTIDLPPNGILDYPSVNIPSGVTVSFKRNAANTPVIIRTSGNVTIAGSIWVGYTTTPSNSGTAGDGVLGDDGQPGTGGPGGFDGGSGGIGPANGGTDGAPGGAGKGPGGGQPATSRYSNGAGYGGAGGGFNGNGANSGWDAAVGGTGYGQWSLLPLVGGSGGGGGAAGAEFSGAGGGGGSGAILIASSGTIYVSGYIYADGGTGGSSGGTNCGGGGGGGSGGAIKLMAEKLDRGGNGYLYARGAGGGSQCWNSTGGGANGYIRLESNAITNWSTGYSTPGYDYHKLTEAGAGKIFVPKNPTLSITGVQGIAVKDPIGVGDVTLPEGTTSATVQLAATNIPIGTTVTVYVIPNTGAVRTSVLSSALDGASDAATTATATVTLKPGNNVLLASASYTVTELVAMNLPRFNGEYVAKVRVDAGMDGTSKVTYITASGKEYPADTPKAKTPA